MGNTNSGNRAMTTSLLAWWSFNNTNNDSDLLNATGDDNARSGFGHLLDNNDAFDDGFYDPAVTISGVMPQLGGIDALFPVSDGFNGSPGLLIAQADPGAGVPDADDYGAYIDVSGLTGDNFASGTANNWGSFSGTGANRPVGTFGGGTLTVTGDGNNGSHFDIIADLSGFSDIEVSWANRGTGTGFDSRSVEVSSDGGATFTEIFNDSGTLSSSFEVETADAGVLLDGAENAVIRFTVDGAGSASGNNRFDNIQLLGSAPPAGPVFTINEVDADTPGNDAAEFVEIFDGGVGNASLEGLAIVFFNGSDDASYEAFNLDGFTTDENGFFVLGNPGVPNVDLTFEPGTFGALQNGADAVGLFTGDAADFPNDTPATTDGLIDVLVYDTNDSDDADLLAALGQTTQFNEGASGDKDTHSNSRVPDGSGAFTAQTATPGTANFAPPPPPDPVEVLISDIQGNPGEQTDGASPLDGQSVIIEGVVIGAYEGLDGFFMQEEAADSDGDDLSSEGIFVFTGGAPTVIEGDKVRVTGAVDEFFEMTQIDNDNGDFEIEVIGTDALGEIAIPLIDRSAFGANDDPDALEQFEGMRVQFAEDLTVSEYFQLNRFGQVVLYEDGRPFQFTQQNEPDVAGFEAHQADLASRRVILDDGNNEEEAGLPDGTIFHPEPGGLSTGTHGVDFFRGGDVVEDLSGILHWSWAGSSGTEAWRVRPVEAAPAMFTPVETRDEEPDDVGGTLKVASVNVLNYFTTIDDGDNLTATGQNPRGAHSEAELARQTDKLVAALSGLGADIYGLVEIENDEGAATQALVDALNGATGRSYGFIDTGIIGTDAIKVAFVYDIATVNPVGDFAILDSDVNPNFEDMANRPALAQTFEEIASGGVFTAAVNHFKSKGSIFGGDVAAGDGSGNNNTIRADAADALVDWLAEDPTGSDDDDYLILGDLNAYAREDPIDEVLEGADDTPGTADDYTDLARQFVGPDGYSFLFDGQIGTLDYALANQPLLGQVTGATEWHINADEVPLFDYNDDIRDAAERDFEEEPSGNPLFEPDAFRSSDHDPILIGLSLSAESFNLVEGTTGIDRLKGTEDRDLIVTNGGRTDFVEAGGGLDRFDFSAIREDASRNIVVLQDYEVGETVLGIDVDEIGRIREQSSGVVLTFEDDKDMIFFVGVERFEDIVFAEPEMLV